MRGIFPIRFCVLMVFLSAVSSTTEQDYEHTANPGLLPFYFGDTTYYYISTFKASVDTAEAECSKLNNFKLLSLESEEEVTQILDQIRTKDINTPFWTSGAESTTETSDGESETFVWKSTSELFSFPNFSSSNVTKVGLMRRKRYDCPPCTTTTPPPPDTTVPSTGPPCTQRPPVCKEVNCTVTKESCNVTSEACQIEPNTKCEVSPLQICHATCPRCKIVEQKSCHVKGNGTVNCTAIPGKCELCFKDNSTNCRIEVPRTCKVERPDCIISQPQCAVPTVGEICTPAPTTPCTTARPCQSTPGPCTTTCKPATDCKTVSRCRRKRSEDKEGLDCTNEAVCSNITKCEEKCLPGKTTCRPIFDCRPIAWVCMTPAIICNNTQTYCPPPVTTCIPPKWKCDEPKICCTEATVKCDEPEVVCEPAVVVCEASEVSCSSPMGHCQEPNITCPGNHNIWFPTETPQSNCPPPTITCDKQPDCEVFPPDCIDPPPTPTPCKPCKRSINNGCVSISTKTEVKWQLESCNKEHYFICESNNKFR